MEQIKEEAERIINLFPVYDWSPRNGYEQNMEITKNYALICIDEMIVVCDTESDNLENLYKVKQYIIDNY